MKVLIVDDEQPARARLRVLLEELDECVVAGEAAGGEEALRLADGLQPDVVLLDIRMPGIDGMETARHFAQFENPPAVIFTTAFDQHALEAFDADAIDYLLKPVRKARLEQALQRARRLARPQPHAGNGSRGVRTHICARNRGILQLVPLTEILYFHADQKYVSVHHLNGEVLIEDSLKSLETEFAEQFVRVHRNALVARSYIEGVGRDKDGRMVVWLRGSGDRIEVSRRHAPNLRRELVSG